MIRLVTLLKRRDDVSVNDFTTFWKSDEVDAAIEHAVALYKPVKWQRARVLNLAIHDEVRDKLGRGEPFDGVLEYWWENTDDIIELFRSEEGQARLAAMQSLLDPYVNNAESRTFFTED